MYNFPNYKSLKISRYNLKYYISVHGEYLYILNLKRNALWHLKYFLTFLYIWT